MLRSSRTESNRNFQEKQDVFSHSLVFHVLSFHLIEKEMASEKDNETIMDVMNRMVREEKKERERLGVGVSSELSQPLVLTPEKKEWHEKPF